MLSNYCNKMENIWHQAFKECPIKLIKKILEKILLLRRLYSWFNPFELMKCGEMQKYYRWSYFGFGNIAVKKGCYTYDDITWCKKSIVRKTKEKKGPWNYGIRILEDKNMFIWRRKKEKKKKLYLHFYYRTRTSKTYYMFIQKT